MAVNPRCSGFQDSITELSDFLGNLPELDFVQNRLSPAAAWGRLEGEKNYERVVRVILKRESSGG